MKEEVNCSEELKQLKEHYLSLKQDLDKQKIVNDEIMKATFKRNVAVIERDKIISTIAVPVALAVVIIITILKKIPLYYPIVACSLIVFLFVLNCVFYKKYDINRMLSCDVLTNINAIKQFKKAYFRYLIIVWGTTLLVIAYFIPRIYSSWSTPTKAVCAVALLILIVIVCLGIEYLNSKAIINAADEIVNTLESYKEYEEE